MIPMPSIPPMPPPRSALRQSFARRLDSIPATNDQIETGPTPLALAEWAELGLVLPDLPALREYRLGRVREQLRQHDYAGILLFDPLNIRYAVDSTNMTLWATHNSARACFIATTGPVILFDFHNCQHLSAHLPLVDEVRTMTSFFYFLAGDRYHKQAERFAVEIADLLRAHGGGNRRLAVDKMEIAGLHACARRQIEVMDDGMRLLEQARSIKNANELQAVRCAMAACDATLQELTNALVPGISESELWAYLHFGNIQRGGEWIETRLLASGPRTNPWMTECGARIIQPGDLVGLDTDLVGVYGYCVDISRTWIAGDDLATDAQRQSFAVAYEHVISNMAVLRPGLTFREMTFGGNQLAEQHRTLQYGVKYHGVGLCDEYPAIYYPEHWDAFGYDGVLQAGMCLSVEAYIGEVGGTEGVKIEEQVVITDDGYELLSHFPHDERLAPH